MIVITDDDARKTETAKRYGEAIVIVQTIGPWHFIEVVFVYGSPAITAGLFQIWRINIKYDSALV